MNVKNYLKTSLATIVALTSAYLMSANNNNSYDWIKNKETQKIEWRNEITSEECLIKNHMNETHEYIGKWFELPDGSGAITIKNYVPINENDYPKEDLLNPKNKLGISPLIEFEYKQNTSEEKVNWAQTFNTNFPNYAEYVTNKEEAKISEKPIYFADAVFGEDNQFSKDSKKSGFF